MATSVKEACAWTAATAAALTLGYTHGHEWDTHATTNIPDIVELNFLNGSESMSDPDLPPDGSVPESGEVTDHVETENPLPITDLAGIRTELVRMSVAEPWCSKERQLRVDVEDISPDARRDAQDRTGATEDALETDTTTEASEDDGYTNVNTCLNADTMVLTPADESSPAYIQLSFTTMPELIEGDGHASFFETYNKPAAVGPCKEMRNEMKGLVRKHLALIIGAQAAELFEIEVHVSEPETKSDGTEFYPWHACDDGFVEP